MELVLTRHRELGLEKPVPHYSQQRVDLENIAKASLSKAIQDLKEIKNHAPSREGSLAITNAEQAMMWLNESTQVQMGGTGGGVSDNNPSGYKD
jgi:hypothetical protein